jgi:hypothetical protein
VSTDEAAGANLLNAATDLTAAPVSIDPYVSLWK